MTYRIEIEGGDAFVVAADEANLLRGALRAGVGFPHDCNVGGCGNCRFDLVSGEMETLWTEAPGLGERDRRRGKRLACQSRPKGDCVIRVRCAEDQRPAAPPTRFQAAFVGRRDVTPDMAEFTFRTDAPAVFRPGQYALLHPPGSPGWRAYSMSNLPNPEGVWRFVVRRVPGGAGSNAMFDALRPGDALAIDGPYGHAFWRDDSGRETICIAGGSGIGPIVSIAAAALAAGRRPRVFEGARTRADLAFPALVDPAALRGIDYEPVLSAEAPGGGWSGARGFVHAAAEAALGRHADHREYYFAGPPPMIEAVQTLLVMNWSVPHDRIHYDRFF